MKVAELGEEVMNDNDIFVTIVRGGCYCKGIYTNGGSVVVR